jgi:hypothetical protein
MQTRVIILTILATALNLPTAIQARVEIWHQGIVAVDVDLRTSGLVVIAQQEINVDQAGRVVVQFDGQCLSAQSDLIVLAASDTPNWEWNAGNTNLMATDNDRNVSPFSHSRVYDVEPGSHVFYAVGENYGTQLGTGIASIYGSLTVRFVPESDPDARVWHLPVASDELVVRGGDHVVATLGLDVPAAGNLLVRCDGLASITAGDFVAVGVNLAPSLPPDDGHTAIEVNDGGYQTAMFSHARVFPVEPGYHEAYLLANNFGETDGWGTGWFYGNIIAEFYPTGGRASVHHAGIAATDIDVRGAPEILAEVTVEADHPGTAFLRCEGLVFADPDDRIVLAVSDGPDWHGNDGHVAVEVADADVDNDGFSHSWSYRVDAPGPRTFYAVCENVVEMDGTGVVDVFAGFTVEYFEDPPSAVGDGTPDSAAVALRASPNPFNPSTVLAFDQPRDGRVAVHVYSLRGELVAVIDGGLRRAGPQELVWRGADRDGRAVPSGSYFARLLLDGQTVGATARMSLVR